MHPETDCIILIDAYSQIFRGYYAIRSLTNSKNQPTNAIYAFTKFLLKLHHEYPSSCGAFAFDCGRPAFRMEIAPDYKANRAPMPDDLRCQLPNIKAMAEAFGWPVFLKEGFEADDLLAGIANDFPEYPVRIISSDKDLSQLVDERVKMLVPDMKSGSMILRGPEEVIEKFAVAPDKIIDYLSMVGDSSDNIPGVPGIGVKTAAQLINAYGSISEIIAAPEKVTNEKLRNKIMDNVDLIRKNIDLITLRTEISDKPWTSVESLKRKTPDLKKITAICQEMELKSIIRDLPQVPEADDLFASPKPVVQQSTVASKPTEPTKFAPDLFGDF
ncbi:MAG: 5'-3' exonuclease H3TH domain-containing protein [Victivallaceae bacterium]